MMLLYTEPLLLCAVNRCQEISALIIRLSHYRFIHQHRFWPRFLSRVGQHRLFQLQDTAADSVVLSLYYYNKRSQNIYDIYWNEEVR